MTIFYALYGAAGLECEMTLVVHWWRGVKTNEKETSLNAISFRNLALCSNILDFKTAFAFFYLIYSIQL